MQENTSKEAKHKTQRAASSLRGVTWTKNAVSVRLRKPEQISSSRLDFSRTMRENSINDGIKKKNIREIICHILK